MKVFVEELTLIVLDIFPSYWQTYSNFSRNIFRLNNRYGILFKYSYYLITLESEVGLAADDLGIVSMILWPSDKVQQPNAALPCQQNAR